MRTTLGIARNQTDLSVKQFFAVLIIGKKTQFNKFGGATELEDGKVATLFDLPISHIGDLYQNILQFLGENHIFCISIQYFNAVCRIVVKIIKNIEIDLSG